MTLQNILEHQAGFPADPQYHNDTYDKDDGIVNGVNDLYSVEKATTREMILKTPRSMSREARPYTLMSTTCFWD